MKFKIGILGIIIIILDQFSKYFIQTNTLWQNHIVKCDKKDVLSLVTYSLLIAGAIGNLIDRLYLGYVRDFLDFYIFGYDFPIFNIADCAVTIGAILLVLVFIKEERSNG